MAAADATPPPPELTFELSHAEHHPNIYALTQLGAHRLEYLATEVDALARDKAGAKLVDTITQALTAALTDIDALKAQQPITQEWAKAYIGGITAGVVDACVLRIEYLERFVRIRTNTLAQSVDERLRKCEQSLSSVRNTARTEDLEELELRVNNIENTVLKLHSSVRELQASKCQD